MRSQRHLPAFAPEIAALTAGGALAAVDLALLGSEGPPRLWGAAVAVILLAAGLLALATRLTLWLSGLVGRGRWRRSLAGAVLALPVILPVSYLLFRGTGISGRWYAPYGPFVVAPLLLVATAIGLRLAGRVAATLADRGRLPRLAVGVVVAGVAAGLLWADARLYPNQYAYLHWLLLLLTALALMGAAWLAGGLARPPRAGWIAPALLLAAPAAVMIAGDGALQTQRLRQAFAERTHSAERLVAVLRALADRDGDHHSVIFGGRDCDDTDPRIYPFAPEVPENGVDEDCDGQDLQRPHKITTSPGVTDEQGYRRALARWRREPGLAGRLQRTAQFNVILIVLDALRADQVLPTAENRAAFPNLMRLLDESRHFVRAFSTGAGTDIGMATVFTGQLDPFTEHEQTLLKALRRGGLHTHGVFQREVERWVGRQFSLEGLDGRDVVVNDPIRRDLGTHATARQVTDRGIRFLQGRGGAQGRFLLWLHYFDIHEHHQIKASTLDAPPLPAAGPPAKGLPFYRHLTRHVDHHLGRLLAALEQGGLAKRTVVAVLGDHGEGLAQRPRLPFNHGDVLFNPLVHVPLAFRVPGVAGQRIEQPVSLTDLCPTLLDLAGIERSPTDGISLVPWVFGLHEQQLAQLSRPLFMYETKQRAVIVWPWKLITWLDQGLVELYHLEHDYAEEQNRVDDLPRVARRLSAALHSRKLITIDRLKKRTKHKQRKPRPKGGGISSRPSGRGVR